MYISAAQAIDVWSELETAYRGENHYGGDTAEIYAYTLMPYSPSYARDRHSALFIQEHVQMERRASEALYELLVLFAEKRECRIEVEGHELGPWLRKTPFSHRCHVRVFPKSKKLRRAI